MTNERRTSASAGLHSWRGVGIMAGAATGAVCALAVGIAIGSGIVAFGGSVVGLVLGATAGALGERAVKFAGRSGTGQVQADYDDGPPAAS